MMVQCKACGRGFKARERDGETEVYNEKKRLWTAECPNCQRYGFNEDDDLGDYDDYEDDDIGNYDMF